MVGVRGSKIFRIESIKVGLNAFPSLAEGLFTNLGVTSTLGESVRLYCKGDSRCELESTGFPYRDCCNKNLLSNQVNKLKQTSHDQSIKW